MSKPITEEQTKAFREYCASEVLEAMEEENGVAYFTIESYDPFEETLEDGEPLWEFHASNYEPDTSHDIYELFRSVSDEFEIEEEGYGSFFISRREPEGK